jgi:AcrR family transcriptional regulator
MGRPREHDDQTREALRAAAERLFDAHGVDGVSVRALADEVGTTTRAVYSLFGSREGLLVDALGSRAYGLLVAAMARHPETDDPVADLIDMAVGVFRRFVVEHPALFRIIFQRAVPRFDPGPELVQARAEALERLTAKLRRLEDARLLRTRSLAQVVIEYQALCEGLGNFEIRANVLPMLRPGEEAAAWREALTTLLRGITTGGRRRKRRR